MNKVLGAALTTIILSGCGGDSNYVPKPKGYHRILLEEPAYQPFNKDCPFTFDYNAEAVVDYTRVPKDEPCWFNLYYPAHQVRIHFSYHPIVKDSLARVTEDSRDLAMKHIAKANDIREDLIMDSESGVYGIIYDFKGSTATNMQFFLTDSTSHFMRAAMYVEASPNPDSIAPVEDYIKQDMVHLVNTFQWKY